LRREMSELLTTAEPVATKSVERPPVQILSFEA
jgi:hypothetical protein